jgi:hypothetical protein
LEQALESSQQAYQMRLKLFPRERFPDGHRELVSSLNSLGNAQWALGRPEQALESYQQTYQMCLKLFPKERFPDEHPDLATSLHNLGNVHRSLVHSQGTRFVRLSGA